MIGSLLITICLGLLSLWIISPRLLKDKEIPFDDPLHKEFTPNLLPVRSPPSSLLTDSKYNFGRYSGPIVSPMIHDLNFLQTIFEKKEWHFIAVNDENLLIGMAVANLGYIETAFIYFCDMKSKVHDKISFVLPGGVQGARVAGSSVDPEGCSSFSSILAPFNVSMCFLPKSNSWRLVGTGVLESHHRLSFDISVFRTGLDEFSLVYPIGPNRAAYTHKTSSLSAEGVLVLEPTQSTPGFSPVKQFRGTGLTDFSRTMARPFTEWFWVAFSFEKRSCDLSDEKSCLSSQGKGHGLHGIQLSQGVYRHPTHSSSDLSKINGDLENIIWIHQRPFYLNSVLRFIVYDSEGNEVEAHPGQNQLQIGQIMKIVSMDGRVKLTYTAVSQMPTELSTPIFAGKLLHTYGVYSGQLIGEGDETITFENIPGILEDHYAKW